VISKLLQAFRPFLSATTITMLFVASIEELVSAVRAALARVADARAALVGAATPVEAAGRALVELGTGSQQPDLPDSAAHLRTAYEQCRQTVALLDQATDLANAFLAAIAGVPDHEPWKPIHNEVDKLRRELPPTITAAERGTGRKTHGRWIGADGVVRPIVSGQDDLSHAAFEWLQARGHPPVSAAAHAEMKLAYHLRQVRERTGQPQHATIVVNNAVCGGPNSCATLCLSCCPPDAA